MLAIPSEYYTSGTDPTQTLISRCPSLLDSAWDSLRDAALPEDSALRTPRGLGRLGGS